MRRAFAGTMPFVMVAWFGAGHAAPQNGAVRNRIESADAFPRSAIWRRLRPYQRATIGVVLS